MLVDKCTHLSSLTFIFLVLTVGRGVAELWSRLLLFQLFQHTNRLSNVP